MNTRLEGVSEEEIDRLRELAHIGASWAAGAFAALAGRTILTRVPMVHGPERFRSRGDWQTGIFCDVEGAISGLVAIFLPAATREVVVSRLCGDGSAPVETVASALSEFGNILASQTVSAIADTLGRRIMPGVPELVLGDAESVLQARMSPRHRPPPPLYIESELFDRQGEFRALHVVVPEVEKVAEPSD
jgi:chemotaxis protein CheY-P-specific phosphatase CheC